DKGKCLLLTFEGAAHAATVYVNGAELYTHRCGYTAFTVDISEALRYGEPNELAVLVDSNETLNQPPFGFVIDYMTYGGIYRDVYLEVKNAIHIADVFAKPVVMTELNEKTDPTTQLVAGRVLSEVTVSDTDAATGLQIEQILISPDGDEVVRTTGAGCEANMTEVCLEASGLQLWDVESPALYTLYTRLLTADGDELDSRTDTIGFRKSRFTKDGYYLNGRRLKIRGLNRHQSYPYVGYAMPKSMQEFDAEILKNELGLNAVRTSHYPQSQYFIDRCDQLGLLVFTEIPGWQHIGGDEWKNIAVENVHDVVVQYRNHPSIILWGVRINESRDDDEFYQRTNDLCRQLDPTRLTAGVKAGTQMSFLEDVYTYNDFSFSGGDLTDPKVVEHACLEKKQVTPDTSRPYFISEYNGHMFPTKTFDSEDHRREHALRHGAVLNSVAARPEICGSFGWCMADYNTHKDFGSGDRICYHGVLDMFRNHKPAAAVYASQTPLTSGAVLELSTTMDIGEHPACLRSDTVVFTNAESVRFYKNDQFIKEFKPAEDSVFRHLAHGPVYIDDFISENMQKAEGWSDKKTALVKTCLNAFARYGSKGITPKVMWAAARLMLFHGLKMSDTTALYNRYVGDWGGEATTYRFEAVAGGNVVATRYCAPATSVHLAADVSSTSLHEDTTYDVAAVRLRMTDQNGNLLPFYGESVQVQTDGAIELIGPSVVPMRGGCAGVYVRTRGPDSVGEGKLTLTAPGAEPVTVTFMVTAD
ncbi:MAG: glycoside hydrolase family 2 protein, partial [Treponemataceae bacterium]|nr:glycoside hydrolase family 2 protein [Treponemataceae bacterium]